MFFIFFFTFWVLFSVYFGFPNCRTHSWESLQAFSARLCEFSSTWSPRGVAMSRELDFIFTAGRGSLKRHNNNECVWVWVVEDVCVDSRAVKWVSSVNNPSKSLRLLRSSKEFQISIIRNFSLLRFFSSLLHFTFIGPSSLFNYAKTTRDYKISVLWRFEEPSKSSLKFEFELKNKKGISNCIGEEYFIFLKVATFSL